MTVDEIQNLLKVCKGKPIHDMIIFLFVYGLRREELMGLRWEDVDFDNKTITIQHTVTTIGRHRIESDTTKTASSRRTYPITSQIEKILYRLKDEQEHYKDVYKDKYVNCDKVFRHKDGSEFAVAYPRQALQRVEAKYNLPLTSLHCLRHSCASYLMCIGWSPKETADWLGHSNISTTMNIYTQESAVLREFVQYVVFYYKM